MSYTNYNHEYRRNKLREPAQLTSDADLWTPTSTQKHMLGCIFETNDGREFRYCKNDSTEIAKAQVIAAQVVDAQQKGKVQTSYGAAAGSVKFDAVFTTGSLITDDELIDGWLLVNDGSTAAMGDLYIIKHNTWITGDTIMRIEIADAGGLRNVLAATDDLTIIKNQYHEVVVKPTTLVAPIVGVTVSLVPASYYFWAQTRGVCSVFMDDGDDVLVGDPVGHIDASTAEGAVGLVASAATDCILGTCIYDGAVSEAGLINLLIP